ncbi:MAG: hypothetical protein QG567_2481 [Campylobacterota bacterium]|nr:hypothetical protein [Campylobacterota bacterium]
MRYYKLNRNGTNWDEINILEINIDDYKQIDLYDDDLKFKGIGLY